MQKSKPSLFGTFKLHNFTTLWTIRKDGWPKQFGWSRVNVGTKLTTLVEDYGWKQFVKTIFKKTVEHNFPLMEILHKKKVWVKFNKSFVLMTLTLSMSNCLKMVGVWNIWFSLISLNGNFNTMLPILDIGIVLPFPIITYSSLRKAMELSKFELSGVKRCVAPESRNQGVSLGVLAAELPRVPIIAAKALGWFVIRPLNGALWLNLYGDRGWYWRFGRW